MDHPEGAGSEGADRVGFDRRIRLEFRGAQISSDGGLLVMRELDGALGLSDLALGVLRDSQRGKNTVHRRDGLFRQSVYGRLAGYEDLNGQWMDRFHVRNGLKHIVLDMESSVSPTHGDQERHGLERAF